MDSIEDFGQSIDQVYRFEIRNSENKQHRIDIFITSGGNHANENVMRTGWFNRAVVVIT